MREQKWLLKNMFDSAFEKSTIEKILGTPFTLNNYVRLLPSGEETFQTILDSLSSACKIICIEFYIFKDDETGKKTAELLKKKAQEGVAVYILYDHYGSYLRTSKSFWLDMKKAGISLRTSHPFKWSNPTQYIHRDHKKLLIIDGQKAFTGGFNIGDEYYGYFSHLKTRKHRWRDTGIYLEGPIVTTLLEIFKKSWTAWGGEPIGYQEEAKPIITGVPVIPIFTNSARSRKKMRKLFFYSIENARKSIFLTTAYFAPSYRLLNALETAIKRGIKLKLLFPGKSDIPIVDYAGRHFYTRLMKAGIEIYNYKGKILHAKTAVFDECWSIVGSANLDFQSFRKNDEGNIGILDKDSGRQTAELFEKDLRHSVKIEPHIWAKRPFYEKVIERFFALFRRWL